MIEHVLRAWVTSRVQHVLIVLRRDDQRLREACREWPVSLVCPEHDPLDMKASLQAGMDYLRQHFEPADTDGVCIAPADLPSLSSELIDQLLAATAFPAVSIPYFAGQSGHPVVLPWSLADELDQLADNEGLDVLLARQPQTRLQLPGHLAPRDIDTPQEYRAALRALGADRPPDRQR